MTHQMTSSLILLSNNRMRFCHLGFILRHWCRQHRVKRKFIVGGNFTKSRGRVANIGAELTSCKVSLESKFAVWSVMVTTSGESQKVSRMIIYDLVSGKKYKPHKVCE